MRKTTLPFLLLCFLSSNLVFSQTSSAPNGLAWKWNWDNFQFPITNDISRHDYTSGGELTYIRYLHNRLNLAIPLKAGRAELPLDGDGTIGTGTLIASLDALLHLNLNKKESWFQPYLLGGAGLMAETENDWELNPEFPVGLGLNFRIQPSVYLNAESQYRFDLNENRNRLQHGLGLFFVLGNEGGDEKEEIADADKDGISDSEDQCPNEAGPAALFGCPDSDGDGVANRLDECPDDPGLSVHGGCPDGDGDGVPNQRDACPSLAGPASNKGCPDNDSDADGVPNDKDRCPDQAGSEYADGCPDLDQDGVADKDDKCPTQSGLPKNEGCPDTDGDGVADPFDKCPETPGIVYNFGCPELKKEEKEVLEFAMKAVQFETGSAKLKPESSNVLNQIADILRNYPEQKLRISGHTDSIGEAADNLELSKRRAKACFDYLAAKGIAAGRMTHQGYGETLPVGDNMFAPGREKNRRVVFEVYVD